MKWSQSDYEAMIGLRKEKKKKKKRQKRNQLVEHYTQPRHCCIQ